MGWWEILRLWDLVDTYLCDEYRTIKATISVYILNILLYIFLICMVMLGMDTTTLCIMVMRKFNMRTRNSNPNCHLISMVIQLQGVFSVGKTLEAVLVSTEFSPPVHMPLWFFTCTDRQCSHTFPWGFGYTYPHICLLQYGSASKPVFFSIQC